MHNHDNTVDHDYSSSDNVQFGSDGQSESITLPAARKTSKVLLKKNKMVKGAGFGAKQYGVSPTAGGIRYDVSSKIQRMGYAETSGKSDKNGPASSNWSSDRMHPEQYEIDQKLGRKNQNVGEYRSPHSLHQVRLRR